MSIKLKDTILDYIDKAYKDSSGNIISSTYLPLSGGTINGKIIFKDSLGIWNDHNDGVLGIHVNGWDGVNSYSAVFGSPSFPTILRSSENVKVYYGGHNYSLIHSGNIGSQSVASASLIKPTTGTGKASTWTSLTSYTRIWGESFNVSSLGSDTGDIIFYLRNGVYTSNSEELCVAIDGDFYAQTGSKKVLHEGNYSSYAATKDHTHNYAGSSSSGGAATSANKLNTSAGDRGTPVYFSNGIPVLCDYLNIKKYYEIDAQTLSTSNFYPVTFGPSDIETDCEIHSPNLGGDQPYNQNVIHFQLISQGWSDTPKSFKILHHGVYSSSEITIGAVGIGLERGTQCVWVRGGLLYRFYCNKTPTLRTSTYTNGNEQFTVGTGYSGGTNTKVTVCWKYGETDPIICTNNHNHDSVYSKLGHTHSEYSPTSHNHNSTYAYVGGSNASGTWGISISGNAATATNATNARYVIADNNAQSPGYALLQSGSGRTDASPSGDTWIYYDSLGGTSTPWGIKHEQASNLISFYGGGNRRAHIDLSNGNIACSTINGYTPITSGNIGSQSVNYATSAGSAGNADKLDGINSTGFLRQVVVPNNTTNDFNTFENMTLTGRVDPTTGASLVNAPWTGGGPAGGYGVLTYLFNGSGYGTQMAWGYGSNRIYIRDRYWGGSGVGSVWRTTWSSIALTSDIPTSLPANGGNADTVDGYHASSFAAASHTHSYAATNHTHNYAGSSSAGGNANYLASHDTRSVTIAPNTFGAHFSCHFKQNNTNGVNDGGNYFGLIYFRPYGSSTDFSGGYPHELAFTENSNIWYRKATSSTAWGSWQKILTSSNWSSYCAAASHTHSYAALSHTHTTIVGSYTANGGQQNPNYFGVNKVGALMMNTTVNGNSHYKDWLFMDCYSGSDVGGGVAIGVNRQALGVYIMRSAAARTSWAESAELLGTHNWSSYCASATHNHNSTYAYVGGSNASGTWGINITGSASSSDSVDGHHFSTVTSLPSSPNSNTVYFVTG